MSLAEPAHERGGGCDEQGGIAVGDGHFAMPTRPGFGIEPHGSAFGAPTASCS